MSYILDALKKAEQERTVANIPTLTTIHEFKGRRRTGVWAVVGAFIICVAVSVSFFLYFNKPIPEQKMDVPHEPAADLPATIQEAKDYAEANAANSAISASMKKEPPPRLPIDTDSRSSAGRSTDLAVDFSKEASAELPSPVARSKRAEALSQQKQNEQMQPGIPLVAMDSPLPQPAEIKEGSSMLVTQDEPDMFPSKAASLREAIDKMEITVLLYDDAKENRLVFINGEKYVEGDYVEGRYLLESITLDGAVLSYRGDRLMLHAGQK